MRPATLTIALLIVAMTSCASLAPGTLSVPDLANAADKYDGADVLVTGVVCNVGLGHAWLQPGPTCKDDPGIWLDLSPSMPWPQQGSRVVVSGLFHDNSKGNDSSPRRLNYPKNQYLGNYSISVRELRAVHNGPNNSFKPKPLRGSA